jgi:acyl carrier protein
MDDLGNCVMLTNSSQPSFARIVGEFENVFKNKGLTPPALAPDTVLDGSLGLESLDFAELVVRLEQVFGKDPFSQDTIPEVRTLADLCVLYESTP